MKTGTQPEFTTMTERTVVKDVEENPVQMASWGVATAQVNAYNVSKIKEVIDQYKYKMAQIKETLREEERVGWESKRKYDATLLDLEKLQQDYQILKEEKDDLKLSNTILDGEKKDLESKMVEIEVQRSKTYKQVEESKVQIAELEAHNSSLDVLLKATNERKMDITPLREHALSLKNKIYQVQVKLVEEVYKIKQVEPKL